MPLRPPKYKLLFDENLEARKSFPLTNNYHDVKHITHDLKKSGLKDPEVFATAKRLKRILVTYTFRDFYNEVLTESVGVIGLSHRLSLAENDKKLITFLKRTPIHEIYGKQNILGGETK